MVRGLVCAEGYTVLWKASDPMHQSRKFQEAGLLIRYPCGGG